MSSLSIADVAIVVISLFLVLGTALYGAIKARSNKNEAEEYFLAGRSMPWSIIAASLFASNIGAEHFVGQAGAAASDGIAISLYEWTASYLLLLLGWVFAPLYLKAKLKTIPEYLEKRFNPQCRVFFVLVTLAAYVVSKIGATVYAGGVLLEVLLGISLWQSTPIIIIATAVYTITGGLTVVMLTDTIQTLIFLVGGLIGTGYGLHLVGGLSGSLIYFIQRMIEICHDQEMTQRVLSAKSLPNAQLGCAMAALFKSIPAFITVVPGMVARLLYELCQADTNGETFPQWCETDLSDSKEADKAYPLLVLREFPNGIRGVMVASFLAAMMSSLSSVYNSASTIFTYDVYERFFGQKGGSPQSRLVMVGRIVTVAITLLTFLWLPVVEASNRGLYLVGQGAMTHAVPAISAVFLCGMFVPFANGIGAMVGMVVGVFFGVVRFIPYSTLQDYCDDRVDEEENSQEFNSFNWLFCLNFNYFAIILFFASILIICGVSYFTERPRPSQIEGCITNLACMTASGFRYCETGLMSTLVQKAERNEEDDVQLSTVQYNTLEENGDDRDNNNTGRIQQENSLEVGPALIKDIDDSLVQKLKMILSVEDGYLPHIVSCAAILLITTLIAVYN